MFIAVNTISLIGIRHRIHPMPTIIGILSNTAAIYHSFKLRHGKIGSIKNYSNGPEVLLHNSSGKLSITTNSVTDAGFSLHTTKDDVIAIDI